jgi:KipI family sensor histidine kinase inhibitor
MGLRALGDSAWLFEAGGTDSRSQLELVLKLVQLLEQHRIPEVRDVVSSFDSVAVHFDPMDGELVLAWVTSLPPPVADNAEPGQFRTVTVPVVYGGDFGPDLKALASSLSRSESEIIKLHTASEYTVAATGFSPGFPYLLGLPPELQSSRRPSPRRVAAGSVAIAGNQTGIYPFESQGGWQILGRTGLSLFDPYQPEPSLLAPGDRVRFLAVDRLDLAPPGSGPPSHCGDEHLEVLKPGAFTTVQDLGRTGYQALGVSPGGAVDPVAARVANRLVGNRDDAAVLECSMQGPVIRFHTGARVACVGWSGLRSGRPLEICSGDTLDLGARMLAVRGYVAIAGGIRVPMVLGSRATDVRAGFGGHGGRALKAGDRLPVGPGTAGPTSGNWWVNWPRSERPHRITELRFLPGVQASWFSESAGRRLRSEIYQISPDFDRTGLRLDGPLLELAKTGELVSQPVVEGSIQVPPDGRPIVLLAERQTIGGYPQIGHVISADLPRLARCWPGTPVRFREVTLAEAREAWRDLIREFGFLRAGLDFVG